MTEEPQNSSNASPDLTKIVLNTLYLCLGRAVEHIARVDGSEAAWQFKSDLLEELKTQRHMIS